MKFLLDTNLLLYAAGDPDRLPKAVRKLLKDPESEPVFSAVSIWEIAVKEFGVEPGLLRRGLLDHGYAELPVQSAHAAAVYALPALHKDLFDRMLVAQARLEGIVLLTTDTTVAQYGEPVRRV